MQYRHAIQMCNTDMQYRYAIQLCIQKWSPKPIQAKSFHVETLTIMQATIDSKSDPGKILLRTESKN